ncbi:cupin domain-containing protein [Streptomyces sp. NPDC057445]|uniref:cupin domain-containing protein n=1 Tax=Streptomyces sp. NPDC057445 TaxID=3346136 RepID=UPI0036985C35
MTSPSDPGVLARLAELGDGIPEDRSGALWRLAADGRQLDANVVRLPPDTCVAEHVEPDLDVLLYVTGGGGLLHVDGVPQDLAAGSVVWLPRGSRRTLHAGSEGLVQLSVHRRRPGLAIRNVSVTDVAGMAGVTVEGVTGVTVEGGEPACLLDRVCVECGRLSTESDARYCGRCGERLPDVG